MTGHELADLLDTHVFDCFDAPEYIVMGEVTRPLFDRMGVPRVLEAGAALDAGSPGFIRFPRAAGSP